MSARHCTVADVARENSGTLVSVSGVVADLNEHGSGWDGFLYDGPARVLIDVGATTYALVSQRLTDGARVVVSGFVRHDWTGPELRVETVHAAGVA